MDFQQAEIELNRFDELKLFSSLILCPFCPPLCLLLSAADIFFTFPPSANRLMCGGWSGFRCRDGGWATEPATPPTHPLRGKPLPSHHPASPHSTPRPPSPACTWQNAWSSARYIARARPHYITSSYPGYFGWLGGHFNADLQLSHTDVEYSSLVYFCFFILYLWNTEQVRDKYTASADIRSCGPGIRRD